MTETQRRQTGGEAEREKGQGHLYNKAWLARSHIRSCCNPGNGERDGGEKVKGEEGTRLKPGWLWHSVIVWAWWSCPHAGWRQRDKRMHVDYHTWLHKLKKNKEFTDKFSLSLVVLLHHLHIDFATKRHLLFRLDWIQEGFLESSSMTGVSQIWRCSSRQFVCIIDTIPPEHISCSSKRGGLPCFTQQPVPFRYRMRTEK